MEPMTPNDSAPEDGGPVYELIRQREQLRGWIDKLDQVKTEAPSRVAERVRADYEARLRQVTEELSGHREEIERSLESVRADLSGAEARRSEAVDALEETRLRHLIGELDERAWEEARPDLEGAVSAADEALERARSEVDRLASLAGEIAGDDGAAPEPEAAAAEPGPVAAEAPSAPAAAAPSAPAAAPSGEELAAWISEVEQEEDAPSAPVAEERFAAAEERPSAPAASAAPQRPTQEDVDGWDPFGGEFGGPAPTQPGDAEDDLPWLSSIDKAAGTGTGSGRPAAPSTPSPSTSSSDGELDFLNAIENAASAEPEADLGDDDLAFLEELDRAISGGAGAKGGATPPATPAPAANLFGGDTTQEAPPPQAQPKGAVLCRECGAINEPQAWYCEICGSEL